MKRVSLGALMALVFLIALGLRARDLERYPLQVDWANYLHSAGVHRLDPVLNPIEDLRDDWLWIWQGDFFGKRMPHSYIHQLIMRPAYRIVGSSRWASALSSVLLGSLTTLLLFFVSLRLGVSRTAALFVGAIAAVIPYHVIYSRSGWSQVSMSFFFVLFLYFSWRLLSDQDGTPKRRVPDALLAGAAALFAIGFHEMAVVGIAVSLAYGSLRLILERRQGRATTELALSLLALAVACLPAAFVAFSAFRQMPPGIRAHTLSDPRIFLGDVGTMFEAVLIRQQIVHQLSIPVVALSIVGLFRLWRSHRSLAVFFTLQIGGVLLGVTLVPKTTAHNVRVFMPVLLLLLLCTGFGIKALLKSRLPRLRGVALAGLTLLTIYYFVASALLIFVNPDIPLQGRFLPKQLTRKGRDAALPVRQYIRDEIPPGTRVDVFFLTEPIFYLKDEGARPNWVGYQYHSVQRRYRETKSRRDLPLFYATSAKRIPGDSPPGFDRLFRDSYALVAQDGFGRTAIFRARSWEPGQDPLHRLFQADPQASTEGARRRK